MPFCYVISLAPIFFTRHQVSDWFAAAQADLRSGPLCVGLAASILVDVPPLAFLPFTAAPRTVYSSPSCLGTCPIHTSLSSQITLHRHVQLALVPFPPPTGFCASSGNATFQTLRSFSSRLPRLSMLHCHTTAHSIQMCFRRLSMLLQMKRLRLLKAVLP